jgi:crotonobetainyl-CoA:carnitine CoA-transferase CaiB-like acyl-CoA transferase
VNLSLEGTRVIDLTNNVSGPMATQILGDLGADVIKVERPSGDDTRGWGPPFWGDAVEGGTFSSLNRNKRSVVLDLKDPVGRESLWALVRDADVLVQNMRPGALDELGFSWERLRVENPRLVYCEISGFGHVGPRAAEPAYDALMQAFSGLMSITGEENRPPARIPVSVLDKGTGMWAAIGVMNALMVCARTGRGQLVQTSLLDTALTWESVQLMGYLAHGDVPERLGSGAIGVAPYQAFPTQDGDIIVGAGNQRLWEKLCAVLEKAELLEDERFGTNAERFRNREDLEKELARTISLRPTDEWVEVLGGAGIPVSPINTVDRVANDPQVEALGALEPVDHPEVDGYTLVNLPIFMDGKRAPIRRRSPSLGEHTDEVLEATNGEQ